MMWLISKGYVYMYPLLISHLMWWLLLAMWWLRILKGDKIVASSTEVPGPEGKVGRGTASEPTHKFMVRNMHVHMVQNRLVAGTSSLGMHGGEHMPPLGLESDAQRGIPPPFPSPRCSRKRLCCAVGGTWGHTFPRKSPCQMSWRVCLSAAKTCLFYGEGPVNLKGPSAGIPAL